MLRRIIGAPQHYDWGDSVSIPLLLGLPLDGHTWAEMWFGTHHGAPAHLDTDIGPLLSDEVGDMTVLVKLLACAQPLSLQTHPNLEQAVDGFALEEKTGVPIDAHNRMYRDASDKPEMLIALTPFEALCGFQTIENSVTTLRAMSWNEEATYLTDHGMEKYLRWALTHQTLPSFSSAPEWLLSIAQLHPTDPAIRIAPLLHHLILQPGEAIALPAGNLHAYLNGFGLEIMKSSDNVIRAGFTSKFVNIEELLSILDLSPLQQPVVLADKDGMYLSPTEAFSVQRIDWKHGARIAPATQQRILFGPIHTELMTSSPHMVLLPAGEELELVDEKNTGGTLWVITQN